MLDFIFFFFSVLLHPKTGYPHIIFYKKTCVEGWMNECIHQRDMHVMSLSTEILPSHAHNYFHDKILLITV